MKNLFEIRLLCFLLFISLPFTQLVAQENCGNDTTENTFEVVFPVINETTEGIHDVPDIWNGYLVEDRDTIQVPNNRPIYALIVAGYANNAYLDEIMLYNFTRYLQSEGAYVHHAWWNNLLAPYMERPLHQEQSHPGSLPADALSFLTFDNVRYKALPGEDYQFVADAKILLTRIREENPNAIIIVAGHSMGGGSVVHLAQEQEEDELIDILAPLDPVGNRNLPFAGATREIFRDYNWTRWRVSRSYFAGYRAMTNTGGFPPNCTPTGAWLPFTPPLSFPPEICDAFIAVHDAPKIEFGSNIVNLHHRYQREALFPFDFLADIRFDHNEPDGSISSQDVVDTWLIGSDPDGWPGGIQRYECCPFGDGIAWAADGHGEIVGYRGFPLPVPLAIRIGTSPRCGLSCGGELWPFRNYFSDSDEWDGGNYVNRRQKLMDLEELPFLSTWENEPYNPELCLVSDGLINLFNNMNKPPTAHAGEDQVVECTGQDGALVTLNGSASTDSDGDTLTFTWTGDFGEANGEVADITLPMGSHCIKLKIEDPIGHIDIDWLNVEVIDTTPPELTVSLSPNLLWPPNHRLRNITATVEATDLCGTVDDIVLYSITSSEFSNEIGSGNTAPDIVGATLNTEDLHFKLRAERSGRNQRRIYSVTYKATDNSGNHTYTSANVIVEKPSSNFNHRKDENNLDTGSLAVNTRNYPNPFITNTTITYYLPIKEHITITVYDLSGKEVDVLFNGVQEAGANYIIFNGSHLSSGVYFYRITSSDGTMINKMVKKR